MNNNVLEFNSLARNYERYILLFDFSFGLITNAVNSKCVGLLSFRYFMIVLRHLV